MVFVSTRVAHRGGQEVGARIFAQFGATRVFLFGFVGTCAEVFVCGGIFGRAFFFGAQKARQVRARGGQFQDFLGGIGFIERVGADEIREQCAHEVFARSSERRHGIVVLESTSECKGKTADASFGRLRAGFFRGTAGVHGEKPWNPSTHP